MSRYVPKTHKREGGKDGSDEDNDDDDDGDDDDIFESDVNDKDSKETRHRRGLSWNELKELQHEVSQIDVDGAEFNALPLIQRSHPLPGDSHLAFLSE